MDNKEMFKQAETEARRFNALFDDLEGHESCLKTGEAIDGSNQNSQEVKSQ